MAITALCSDNVVRTFDQNGFDTVNNFHYFDFVGFDACIPHESSRCEGNCSKHPLMHADWLMSWADLNERELKHIEAMLTPAQKAKIAADAEAEKAAHKLAHEALKREQYARDIKEKAQMGLKKNEKPKKIQQPCKWVVGQFKGDECWAWEYTDPKSGKRECPHTCQRLHIGEEGWHDQWLTNPRWEPPATGFEARFQACGTGLKGARAMGKGKGH